MGKDALASFILGVGVGVGLGLLFAPKSGEETRQFLRSKAEEGTDYVKRRAEDLRDTASDAIDRSKEGIRRHKENLSAAVDAGKQAYREAVKTPLAD